MATSISEYLEIDPEQFDATHLEALEDLEESDYQKKKYSEK
jgi:hypothetical protein